MDRRSTSPLPGFCANVLMMWKSFYSEVGVLSIPSSPGTEALDVSCQVGVAWGSSWSNHAGVPGTL